MEKNAARTKIPKYIQKGRYFNVVGGSSSSTPANCSDITRNGHITVLYVKGFIRDARTTREKTKNSFLRFVLFSCLK